MGKQLTPLEKEVCIKDYYRIKAAKKLTLREYCEVKGISEPSLKKWIKQYEENGLEGLCRASKDYANVFIDGENLTNDELKRKILILTIENERLKKNYTVRTNSQTGQQEYIRLKPKNTKL